MRWILLLLLLTSPAFALPEPATRPTISVRTEQLLAHWLASFNQARFSSCLSEPFVIAGDLSPADLQRWRDRTIRPAVAALQQRYFKTAPDRPILILLFASESSYRRYAKEWFNDTDISHFGYFRRDNVMLMNISTGGGTLVHELVHALLRPDFPACPDWLNEGLGSLYEQCTLDPLQGLPNWRLPALQEAIKAKAQRSLTELLDDDDFYDQKHVGGNYAQARYLLLYLQEKDLLQTFYTRLRDQQSSDPTGRKTLQAIIAPQKLSEFESQWQRWVLSLRF